MDEIGQREHSVRIDKGIVMKNSTIKEEEPKKANTEPPKWKEKLTNVQSGKSQSISRLRE